MIRQRTHNCNELRLRDAGKKVILAGFMENVREVGKNFAFLVLRDFYGTTQVVIETAEMMDKIRGLNTESTIAVSGTVRERSSKNPKLPTGDIEIVPDEIEVLGKCIYNELPFEINRSREADENLRLRYRYLDLRNPAVRDKIVLRSRVIKDLRDAMTEEGFLEITTPILTSSSPEGARDYLVPSRNHPGKFYALPQAPQQFKQILMASGIDRYFQIAPCFRDEDARADRSPGEFYQLDMEMAFAGQDEVFAAIEKVLPPVFARHGIYDRASEPPFRRIGFRECMERYGTDKPDLRIDLEIQDISGAAANTEFGPFKRGPVKAVVVSGFTGSRKKIEKLLDEVEVQAGARPYWFKTDSEGGLAGGVAKFFDGSIREVLGIGPDTLVGITAGDSALKTAGVFIKVFGSAAEGHMDRDKYEFAWIVDFPMYEIGEESGQLEFCHNPFSMPQGGLEAVTAAAEDEKKALEILAYQYDLVCNGVELSSGAVRNHDPEIMIKAFEVVGMGEEDVRSKFPAMYNAFCYGAPPHAGIAPGIDRMIMLMAGETSIREIIPFPMNKNAQDLMMGAPSEVDDRQLRDVHIRIEKGEGALQAPFLRCATDGNPWRC